MIETHLDLTYTIIWSLALANIIGAGLCLGLAGPVASLTRVRFTILAPLITILILFAAYQATRATGDLIALAVVGAIGVLFKKADWSRPAFLIGFVLATGAETYFYQAVQFQGSEAFSRPGVLIIGAMILAVLFVPALKALWRKYRRGKTVDKESAQIVDDPVRANLGGVDVLLLTGLLGLAAFAWSNVADLSLLGSVFPKLAIIIMAFGCLAETIRHVLRRPQWQFQGFRQEFIWLLGFCALIAAILGLGFISTAAVFCLMFLLGIARLKLWTAAGMAVGVVAFLLGMAHFLTLTYPTGMLDTKFFS